MPNNKLNKKSETVVFPFKLPAALLKRLKRQAKVEGVSAGGLIRKALAAYLAG